MNETDTGYLDDIEDAPLSNEDLYDPAKTSDEQFLDALKRRYPEAEVELPDPVQPPAPQPVAPVPAAAAEAQQRLDDLNKQIGNLQAAIAAQEPTADLTAHTEEAERAAVEMARTVPMRAEAERLRQEAARLEQSIEFGFVEANDNDLYERGLDATIALEDVEKTIAALPAESMRTEADKARFVRAQAVQDTLQREAEAIKAERFLRREMAGYAVARERDIDQRTDQLIAAEERAELTKRLDAARRDPNWSPDLAAWITRTFREQLQEPSHRAKAAAQRAKKRAEVEKNFDAEILAGVRDQIARSMG